MFSAMLTRQIKVLVLRQTFFKHPCKQKLRSCKGFQAKQCGQSRTEQPELNQAVRCSAEHACLHRTFTAISISLSSFFFLTDQFGHKDPDLILPLSFISRVPVGASSVRGLGYLLIHRETEASDTDSYSKRNTEFEGEIGVCNKWVRLEG